MPHYENVPFEVPDNWIWTTVEEILELISGQDFPPEKYNNNVSGVPYIIGASNIENEQNSYKIDGQKFPLSFFFIYKRITS